jgi:hypothetical protein
MVNVENRHAAAVTRPYTLTTNVARTRGLVPLTQALPAPAVS